MQSGSLSTRVIMPGPPVKSTRLSPACAKYFLNEQPFALKILLARRAVWPSAGRAGSEGDANSESGFMNRRSNRLSHVATSRVRHSNSQTVGL
jgi:hypothetical protein